MATSYTLLLAPKFRAFNLAGGPLSGGKVYVYEAGTTTPKPSYTTAQMTAANAWPVVLDSNGEANVWVSGPFKVVVTDADGVQLYTQDSLYGFGGIYTTLPEQEEDKLIVWGAVDGALLNSNLTLSAIEIAVNAFNVALITGGAVVVADVGDTSPGTLTDKLLVSGALTKSITTDVSGNKRVSLSVDDPVGSSLYLYENCSGL